MNDFRKILWGAFHGFILAGVITTYSHAADVRLTQFFKNDWDLMTELSSVDSLDFVLPMGENLGQMRGAEISEDASSLAIDYPLILKLNQAPSGTYTLSDPLNGEAKNGRRFRLRKGTQVLYQLADTHNLFYEIRIPKDTLLEKVASTDPTEYALAADTNVMVKPPQNRIVKMTIKALTRVEMLPGSAFLGTTLQVEQRRAPVNGYITLTIANDDFDFSKARFEIGVKIPKHNNDKKSEPYVASDAVELTEILPGKAKLKARIPEIPTLTGMFLASPVDLLVIAQGPDDSIAEVVSKNFKVSSRRFATLCWIIAALAPWTLAAFIATRRAIKKEKGQEAGNESNKVRKIDPIWFVSGKYGNASLSLAQILLWTFLVFSASFYVLIASGKLLDLTDEVLMLLGIAGGSSVIAKISASVKSEKGRDLSGVAVRSPKWQDLVQTEGRPDLYKFQMLMFTALAALFVVFKIAGTFEFPALPAGLLTLIGISNGVYLAAKTSSPTEFEKLAEADRKLQVAIQKVARCKKRVDEKESEKKKAGDKLNAATKEKNETEKERDKAPTNAEIERLPQLMEAKKRVLTEAQKIYDNAKADKEKAGDELTDAETKKADLERQFNDQKSKIAKVS